MLLRHTRQAFRRPKLWPLYDLLLTPATLLGVTQSSLHRWLLRHKINCLPDLVG
jgi:hypothetical protein